MLFARSFCIAFSFLAVAIDFARSLAVENFDLFTVADSAITNDFSLDGISTFSAESATALSNPDSIFASDPSSTEESLFADNIGETDESCHDGSFPAPSVIGRRLRLREEFDLISGGNTCVNPPKKFNEEDLNPFLRQLPELISPPDPGLQENRNICPEKDYAKHKIPVCSSGYEVDQVGIPGTTSMFTLNHATPYRPYGCPHPEELWCCITISVMNPSSNYMKYDPLIEDIRWRFFEIIGYSCVKVPDLSIDLLQGS